MSADGRCIPRGFREIARTAPPGSTSSCRPSGAIRIDPGTARSSSFATRTSRGVCWRSHSTNPAVNPAVMCCTTRIGNGKSAGSRGEQIAQRRRTARRRPDTQHLEAHPVGCSRRRTPLAGHCDGPSQMAHHRHGGSGPDLLPQHAGAVAHRPRPAEVRLRHHVQGPGCQHLDGGLRLPSQGERRKGNDGDGLRSHDPPGRLDPVHPRHLDVHQDHARAKRPRHLHGFPAGSRLSDDPDPRIPLHHRPDDGADGRGVIDDKKADGVSRYRGRRHPPMLRPRMLPIMAVIRAGVNSSLVTAPFAPAALARTRSSRCSFDATRMKGRSCA